MGFIEGILGFIFKFALGTLMVPIVLVVAVILAIGGLFSSLRRSVGNLFKDIGTAVGNARSKKSYERRDYNENIRERRW